MVYTTVEDNKTIENFDDLLSKLVSTELASLKTSIEKDTYTYQIIYGLTIYFLLFFNSKIQINIKNICIVVFWSTNMSMRKPR